MQAHRRHDISDKVWSLLEPHLPGKEGKWGGVAKDNRLFVNAVFWIMRTGAPCRDLLQTTEAGVIRIDALSDGVIKEFGKNFWKF